MGRDTSGNRGDVRQSALWGSGNRGGELRSSALWGKGGRGIVTLGTMVLTLALPLAATAGSGSTRAASAKLVANPAQGTYVAQGLLKKAKANPSQKISVIVQANGGLLAANKAVGLGSAKKQLGLIGAVTAEVNANQLEKLAATPGLTVTEDVAVKPLGTAYTSSQLWTAEAGVNKLWDGPKAATIAIVDSGIDATRADFSGRVKAQVSFVGPGSPNKALGDGRGHGTFVAGIAAGSGAGYAGSAPNADLIDLDVLDDTGSGKTSDVIAAVEWIYANKAKYGIRVANFSLHSGTANHFYLDPLNLAVEKLWHSGVVVVAASGNYGVAGGPSGVRYAPASDPFVITVGAVDIGGTAKPVDDARATWSAYGRTPDGFWKPEICASGRFMVGPVPATSTLALERPTKLKGVGYIELSGTSFSAPVVSGLAAQILGRNPSFTPDQVKGALMLRARPVMASAAQKGSCGVGQINAVKAALDVSRVPNPNLGLNRFLVGAADGSKVFDAVTWNDVTWNDVTWNDVTWSDVTWSDVTWEDQAEGDESPAAEGYVLTPEEEVAAASDPDLLAPGEAAPAVEAPLEALLP